MEDILRLRIGDLKEEAEETAKFIGVSVSALTRMALRNFIEEQRPRMQASKASHLEPQHSATEAAS